MNNIQVFNFNSQQVRTVLIDNVPWFIAKDVSEFFGDSHYRRSIGRIDNESKGVTHTETTGGMQEMSIINESGLYQLLFLMEPQKSNLQSVEQEQINKRIEKVKSFRKWITSEVLPSIRKTGSYNLNQVAITSDLLQQITDSLRLKEKEIQALKPKAEFFDSVASSKSAIQIGDVAKMLGIVGVGRNNLFEILREEKILMKDNMPYQTYCDKGYFRVIEQTYTTPEGEKRISLKTLVYQTGIAFIQKILKDREHRLVGSVNQQVSDALENINQ